MAREIVSWCDPCMAKDERTPGREHTITIGVKPRLLALCQPHEDEYLKPLVALLDEHGQPVDAPPKQAAAGKRVLSEDTPRHLLDFALSGSRKGRVPEGERNSKCLWCPLSFASDGSGLLQHVDKIHGLPRSVKHAFGPECALCGNAFELLGGHVKKSHGCDSITEALLQAKDMGDPFGVYAKVLARAEVISG